MKPIVKQILAVIIVILLMFFGAILGNPEDSKAEASTVKPMRPSVEDPLSPPVIEHLTIHITSDLRYHDYYNELVHKQRASTTSTNIMVTRNNETVIYQDVNDITIHLFNVGMNEKIYFSTEGVPTEQNINVRVGTYTLTPSMLDSHDIELYLPYDFLYPTEGIKYPLTQVEREAMSSIVALEAGGGNSVNDVKLAVASIIINRRANRYGSIMHLIFAKNAFSTSKLVNQTTGKTTERNTDVYPYKSCKDAVDLVSLHGTTIPSNVLWFKSLTYDKKTGQPITYHKFGTPYKKIGGLYFSCK